MSSASQRLYINAPELLTAPERTRDTVFTAIMWGVYLYLWLPLISLFAWLLGFDFAYEVLAREGGLDGIAGILLAYGIIILVILAAVICWSLGNLWRYGKLVRRSATREVSIEEIAEYFDVDSEIVKELQSIPSVSIDFDAEGRMVIERDETDT